MKKYARLLVGVIAAAMVITGCAFPGIDETEESTAEITTVPEDTTVVVTEPEKTSVPVSAVGYQYVSLEELTAQSDWVLQGTVIDQRFEWHLLTRMEGGMPYTVTTLQVEDVYKGVYASETIEVWELGGESKDCVYTFEERAVFAQDQSYIVFLDALSTKQNAAFVKGHQQGQYPVDGDNITIQSGGFSIDWDWLEALKTQRDWSEEKPVQLILCDRILYSYEEILEKSNLIVYGTVIDQRYLWCSTDYTTGEQTESTTEKPEGATDLYLNLYTVYTIKVHRVYQGEIGTEIIEVRTEGGETDSLIVSFDHDSERLDMFTPYVLFLGQFATGSFYPKGGSQGIHRVDGMELIGGRYANKVTFEMLEELAANSLPE